MSATESQLATEISHLATEYYPGKQFLREGSTIYVGEDVLTIRKKADFIRITCMKDGEMQDFEILAHKSTGSDRIAKAIAALLEPPTH